jgi:hypothetical protein
MWTWELRQIQACKLFENGRARQNVRSRSKTYLVDKQHTRYQFSNTLVDVPLHDLVDLAPELLRHLGPSALDELAHDRHDVLSSLGLGVGRVEVV